MVDTHTSLPFMMAALPSHHVKKIALTQTLYDHGHVSLYLDKILPEKYIEVARYYREVTWAAAYSNQADEEVLVLYPTLWQQSKLPQKLVQDGWQVQRWGLVIRAWRHLPPTSLANFTSITKQSFKERIMGRHHPTLGLLATTDAGREILGMSQLWWVAAIKDGKKLYVEADSNYPFTRRIAWIRGLELPYKKESESDTGSHLRLFLPVELYTQPIFGNGLALTQDQFHQQFGVHRKKITFNELLADQKAMYVDWTGETMVLGAEGNVVAWKDSIIHLLEEEDRYRRPSVRAFRLPDGGRGGEYIPGPVQPVLESAPAPQHIACLHTKSDQPISIALCYDEQKAVLGHDLHTVLTTMKEWPAYAYLSAGGDWLQKIGLTQVTSAYISPVTDDRLSSTLWLR